MYNGQTPSRNNSKFWNDNIFWLTSGELNHGTIKNTIEKISKLGQKDKNLRLVKKGTFVIAITGLEAAGIRGNCAILGIDTTLNQSVMAIYPDPKKVTNEFLFNWYEKVGQHYGIIYTQGTKQQSYNSNILNILPISITPSLKEQRQINQILKKVNDFIDLQQRKLELLKEIKKGLLQKMFADKSNFPILRFEGFHAEWEQRKLGELYSYHNGKAHEQNQRSSGKYELINLNSISVDGTLKSSGRYINHADEILRQNDLVMILSDIAHGTLLGRVAIIPQDNKYVLNQRVALLRPISKSENSNFMAPLINNNQRYFHKMGIGTSQLNISKSTVIESLWQIPKIKEQSVIGNFLQNIDHIIALQHQRLSKLDEIKKSLLQQMFI